MANIYGTLNNDTLNGTSENDFIYGGDGNDTLNGSDGNDVLSGDGGLDVLTGGYGDDVFYGGTGANTMIGGAGNDTFYLNSLSELVLEQLNEGIDHIMVQFDEASDYSLPDNIEGATIPYASAITSLIGNGLDNNLAAGPNTVMIGGLGNDVLRGEQTSFGINSTEVTMMRHVKQTYSNFADQIAIISPLGADTLISGSGGALTHSIIFLNNTYSRNSFYDIATDFISTQPLANYIVNLSGVNTPVSATLYTGPVGFLEYQMIGDSGSNVIQSASTYNDYLLLKEGNDAANAGAGDDVLDGGSGSNFLTGGSGSDTFSIDTRGGNSWSTITDFSQTRYYHYDSRFGGTSIYLGMDGDDLNIWGWQEGTSKLLLSQENGGAAGYTGATFHFDINGDNSIDTSITFTGKTVAEMTDPRNVGSIGFVQSSLDGVGLLWV